MEKVVENMEGALDHSEQKRLCRKVKENATASAFKADCLMMRCELVELRQNARWEKAARAGFFSELIEDITQITPLTPVLSERLKNHLSFQCLQLERRQS